MKYVLITALVIALTGCAMHEALGLVRVATDLIP